MESNKRERDEEEQQVRTILQKIARVNFVPYMRMSREEKDALGLGGIGFLGKDLVQYIGTLEPGILLSLSLQSKFFYDLSMSEFVWKNMFQQHFPVDYRFCNGELPFYVITKDHPFYKLRWTDGSIDTPGWRRFYLHVRNNYVGWFQRKFNGGTSSLPPFKIIYKTVMDVAYTLIDQPNGHRATLAEHFCRNLMFFFNQNEDDLTFADYQQLWLQRTDGYPWLQKYFSKTASGYFNTNLSNLFTDQDHKLFVAFLKSGVWDNVQNAQSNIMRQKMDLMFHTFKHAYNNLCVTSLACRYNGGQADEARFSELVTHSLFYLTHFRTPNNQQSLIVMSRIGNQQTDPGFMLLLRIIRARPIWSIRAFSAAFIRDHLDISVELRTLFEKYNDVPRKPDRRINLIQQQCITCKVSNDSMYTCAKCNNVIYCGEKCQREHWRNGHNDACTAMDGEERSIQ